MQIEVNLKLKYKRRLIAIHIISDIDTKQIGTEHQQYKAKPCNFQT